MRKNADKRTARAVNRMRLGDKRAIGRLMSVVENGDSQVVLDELFQQSGGAYHVGITGPPGAGKSTLVNALAEKLSKNGRKIGIVAVDPTSPFSGGALLGDRVRMTALGQNPDVFIRSMASRGSLGGLARKTRDVALVLDAAGMDYILIETIGVGQVELDIAQLCDTTIVVLVPESGDSIQALKAGLLEIADIITVNKGDRDGSEQLMMELKFAYDLRSQRSGWQCPILKTIATERTGIDELQAALGRHREYLVSSGELARGRKHKLSAMVIELVEEKIKAHLKQNVIGDRELRRITDLIHERKTSPYKAAEKIVRSIVKPTAHGAGAGRTRGRRLS